MEWISVEDRLPTKKEYEEIAKIAIEQIRSACLESIDYFKDININIKIEIPIDIEVNGEKFLTKEL
jgi:hypothetical protein